jgi:hypothetical protein
MKGIVARLVDAAVGATCPNFPRAAADQQWGRMSIRSYKDLDVWKLSVELAVKTDLLAEELTRARRFDMADQLLRALYRKPPGSASGGD